MEKTKACFDLPSPVSCLVSKAMRVCYGTGILAVGLSPSVTNPNNAAGDASYEHAQRTHDVMLISTIALWAMLIGFLPVAALRLLGA